MQLVPLPEIHHCLIPYFEDFFCVFQYGLCHTFNSGRNNHPLLSSTSTHKEEGFTLAIKIDYEEYYGRGSAEFSGVIFALHDQTESPEIKIKQGTLLSPGFISSIKIQKRKVGSILIMTKKIYQMLLISINFRHFLKA